MKKRLFILILSITLCSTLFSHGVDMVTIAGGTGMEARYDTGEPMAHAEVTVYSPDNREEPFQSGVTDRNGRFMFLPDRQGKWKVVVNDWSGHGGTVFITVNEKITPVPDGGNRMPGRGMKILAGIAVIFGLTGILFFFMARRDRRRKADAHS